MEVAWVHNWEVMLACILLLVLMVTFLLLVWRIILCCDENRKRRKAKKSYLNLEDHMPSVRIVVPSKDPHYRVLAEYHNNENLIQALPHSCKMPYCRLSEPTDTAKQIPKFHTKPVHMQQCET